MTHPHERPDAPELPEGHGPYLHATALLIMVLAFLTSVVAYLETKADNAEARADRKARVEMLGTVKARNQHSLTWDVRLAASGGIGVWQDFTLDDPTAGAKLTLQAFIAREAAIARQADAAMTKDSVLEADASNHDADVAFYLRQESATAYAHERDAHTSQVARYVTVITDLAIALFLLGLVATLPHQARPFFIGISGAIAVGAVAWSAYIASAGAAEPDMAAIKPYAAGRAALDAANSRLCPGAASDYRVALNALSRAVARRPDYETAYAARGEARIGLALCAGATRELANAEGDLERATQGDPRDASAWNDLAVAHWWQGELGQALVAVTSAWEIDGEDPSINFNLLEGLAVLPDEHDAYRDQLAGYRQLLDRLGVAAAFELDSAFADLNDSAAAWFASGPESRLGVRAGLRQVCTDLVAAVPSLNIRRTAVDCGSLGAWESIPTFKRVNDGARNTARAADGSPRERLPESPPPLRASS
jgi:tetratricopeptide (TPR) repeat protein